MAEEKTVGDSEAAPVVGVIHLEFDDHSTNIRSQRFENIDMGQLIIAWRVLDDMVQQQFTQARIAQMSRENILPNHGIQPVHRSLRKVAELQ